MRSGLSPTNFEVKPDMRRKTYFQAVVSYSRTLFLTEDVFLRNYVIWFKVILASKFEWYGLCKYMTSNTKELKAYED